MAIEGKREVISQWKRKHKGKEMVMVVYKRENGKNQKGRMTYHSMTRHEPA